MTWKAPGNAALIALFILGVVLTLLNPPTMPTPLPRLSPEREKHILYGDITGGGHLHGTGKPCKSEFPAEWGAEKVIRTIRTLAANDNIDWRAQDNGYHTAELREGLLRIRIVVDAEKDDIVTAYPVNVQRNPCPARRG